MVPAKQVCWHEMRKVSGIGKARLLCSCKCSCTVHRASEMWMRVIQMFKKMEVMTLSWMLRFNALGLVEI